MKLRLLILILAGASAFFASPLARAFPAYHELSEQEAAKAEAQQRGLPLAWLGSTSQGMLQPPSSSDLANLSKIALDALQGRAVVIFIDGRFLYHVPDIVAREFRNHDSQNLPHLGDWAIPKVVFTDPHVTKILSSVSHAQMEIGRDGPLISALIIIQRDPNALVPLPPAPVVKPPPDTWGIDPHWIAAIVVVVGIGLLVIWLAAAKRL